MNRGADISKKLIKSLKVFEETLYTMEYPDIYHKINMILPKNNIKFDSFGLDTLIACEIVCSSICHKINWDFLRKVVYEKTRIDKNWLNPEYLAHISSDEVYELLSEYDKKERIMDKERSAILRDIGKNLANLSCGYKEIFFDFDKDTNKFKNIKEIEDFFFKFKAFSNDPEQKKMQLVFQSLSDFSDFDYLLSFCSPTIDYHLIRLFLRRRIVIAQNQYTHDYVFATDKARNESTVAALRNVCATSLKKLSSITALDIKSVNRIEWWIGRTVCVNGNPDCELKFKESEWLRPSFSVCPYYDTCHARKFDEKFLEIDEPIYNGKSY